MFSLIITIVSIALVVALVAATMYHGGDVLTQGRVQADAAALVAGAQQITGATAMFEALESAPPADVAALVTADYLSSQPSAATDWTLDTGNKTLTASVPAISDDVCQALVDAGSNAYTCADVAGTNTFTFNY